MLYERPHRPEPSPHPASKPNRLREPWRSIARAVVGDPRAITTTSREARTLDAAGVVEPVARRYAVWRRSALWVAAACTTVSAVAGLGGSGWATNNSFLTPFGLVLIGYVLPVCTFAIPVGAVWAALRYTRPSNSSQVLVGAAAVSIGVPLAVMFVPVQYLAELRLPENTPPEARAVAWGAVRTLVGVMFYVALVPTVLSLLAAVSRASVTVKMFLPESVVPGWGLVTSVPLTVLLSLAAFVLLYHAAGNWLLLLGVVLVVGSPLIYLTRFEDLTRPVSADVARGFNRTGLWVTLVSTVGGLCVLAFLLTATVLGKRLVGFDPDEAWLRPWSFDLVAKFAEYFGRSLFMTVLFADLLVRMSLSVWLEEQKYHRGANAVAYDAMMTGLGTVAACHHLSAEIVRQGEAESRPVK